MPALASSCEVSGSLFPDACVGSCDYHHLPLQPCFRLTPSSSDIAPARGRHQSLLSPQRTPSGAEHPELGGSHQHSGSPLRPGPRESRTPLPGAAGHEPVATGTPAPRPLIPRAFPSAAPPPRPAPYVRQVGPRFPLAAAARPGVFRPMGCAAAP